MIDLHPDWSRRTKANQYIAVYCPDHPNAWPKGYVYEHRLVMELHLNRLLDVDEIVHHRDEDKTNNKLSNLEVTNRVKHSKHHARDPALIELICPECGEVFIRRANQRATVKGYKKSFCSRSCSGKNARREQLRALGEMDIT